MLRQRRTQMGLAWSGRSTPGVDSAADTEAPADTVALFVEEHDDGRFKEASKSEDNTTDPLVNPGMLTAGTVTTSNMHKVHITGKVTVYVSNSGSYVVLKDHV